MKRKKGIRRKTGEPETATLSDFVSLKIFKGRNDLLFMFVYNIKTPTRLAPLPHSCGLLGPFCSVDQCLRLDPPKDTAK